MLKFCMIREDPKFWYRNVSDSNSDNGLRKDWVSSEYIGFCHKEKVCCTLTNIPNNSMLYHKLHWQLYICWNYVSMIFLSLKFQYIVIDDESYWQLQHSSCYVSLFVCVVIVIAIKIRSFSTPNKPKATPSGRPNRKQLCVGIPLIHWAAIFKSNSLLLKLLGLGKNLAQTGVWLV